MRWEGSEKSQYQSRPHLEGQRGQWAEWKEDRQEQNEEAGRRQYPHRWERVAQDPGGLRNKFGTEWVKKTEFVVEGLPLSTHALLDLTDFLP